ncbi:MAG: lipid-A-disaccharide synthase [Pseudomonadota bacterium]
MARRFYIIAGEPSGDRLGARLIEALRRLDPSIEFKGLGGAEMQAQGLESLFDIRDLSVMGLFEIVPHLSRLRARLRQTLDDVVRVDPDVLITIDSPGFTTRLVSRLGDARCLKLHYVAPTVWAWKPGRARRFAELFDMLLCLLPFEPPYFTVHGLDARFCGHPLASDGALMKARIAPDCNVGDDGVQIALIPGSRKGEISRHLPVLLEVALRLAKKARLKKTQLRFIMPALDTTRPMLESALAEFRSAQAESGGEVPKIRLVAAEARWSALAPCRLAIAASGSVMLELAALGVPAILIYRLNPVTYWIVRRLTRIEHAHLLNVMADREIVPEFLQGAARPDRLCDAAMRLLDQPHAEQQCKALDEQLARLRSVDAEDGASSAAQAILSRL